jgi:hypothetical protein
VIARMLSAPQAPGCVLALIAACGAAQVGRVANDEVLQWTNSIDYAVVKQLNQSANIQHNKPDSRICTDTATAKTKK